MPSSAAEIRAGSRAVYWAAWLASTSPVMISAVPLAPLRSWRTARGRAWPLKVASAVASAAVTTMVSAAAIMAKRCAFIRGSVSEPRVKPISTGAYDPDRLIRRVPLRAGTGL